MNEEILRLLASGLNGVTAAIRRTGRGLLDIRLPDERNKLGHQSEISIPASLSAGPPLPLFQTMSKEGYERNPETVTISFRAPKTINQSTDVLATMSALPRGIVRWGSGNNTNEVTLDIIKGVQVTVTGTSVEVFAFVEVFANFSEDDPSVSVGADISYGNRAGSGVAPCFTRIFADSESGLTTTGLIPIPNFAKDVTVYGLIGTIAPPLQVTFISDNAPTSIAAYVTAASSIPTTVPIPGGTQFIQVDSDPEEDPVNVIVVRFGLAI